MGPGYGLLRTTYTVAPILLGADKFFHLLVDWDKYLAPALRRGLPLSGHSLMSVVGVIEILAGLLVWIAPRYGGYVVFAWLLGIVVNLLVLRGYFDIAARDLALSMGALALARMSPAGVVAFGRGRRARAQ